ncbi:MAG: hypothetical protein FWC41_10315 [Firmicutes bacterium]|nr:hypothetical protein [Bacillota bacterium]
MDNIKRLVELPESKYQVISGIQKFTFDKMLEILENANMERFHCLRNAN